jgi:uncharacterized protein (DUF608 family)
MTSRRVIGDQEDSLLESPFWCTSVGRLGVIEAPSRMKYTQKKTSQTDECSYFLFEKRLKQHFIHKNL